MNKNKGKHILERDSIELSEEGYKRLIEAESNPCEYEVDCEKIDVIESIKRGKELLELMPRDIEKVSFNGIEYRFKNTLRVMIENTDNIYHAYADGIRINGFGFTSKEAFEDFKEILTNLIVMVFNNEPISKLCKKEIQWAKDNVEVVDMGDTCNRKIWVHIISSDLNKAMYIDGNKVFEDDTIDAIEAMDILAREFDYKAVGIDFTYEDIDQKEALENDWTYDDMFPYKIHREDFDNTNDGYRLT